MSTRKLYLSGGVNVHQNVSSSRRLMARIPDYSSFYKQLKSESRVMKTPVLLYPRQLSSKKGFTLIELMVVMVILGILAGLIVPRIMDRPEEARRTKAGVQIQSIEQALQLYKLDNGRYPTTEQGLRALVEPPSVGNLAKKWRSGGYLEKGKVPKDPWDNEFIYISPGLHSDFDLTSYGPDGQAGGEGMDADINSWELE